MGAKVEDPGEVQPGEVKPAGEAIAREARDTAHWAKQVSRLKVGEVPAEALNLNVEGRRVVSPIQGFGKMWQKTYRVRLDEAGISPTEVVSTWKERFPEFWPEGNRFYAPLTGIAPGEVGLINLSLREKKPTKTKLSTGVLVLYSDDESFTFMTPEGHMFAGWITFSAYEDGDATVAQAQALIRANDPLTEMAFALGAGKKEDRFWERTLISLAAHFGVDATVETQILCVDPKRQWRRVGNIRHSAAIRSMAYAMGTPARWVAKPFRRKAKAR